MATTVERTMEAPVELAPPAEKKAAERLLTVLGAHGGVWDFGSTPEGAAEAAERFDAFRTRGFSAFAGAQGQEMRRIETFDPAEESIKMVGPMAGG